MALQQDTKPRRNYAGHLFYIPLPSCSTNAHFIYRHSEHRILSGLVGEWFDHKSAAGACKVGWMASSIRPFNNCQNKIRARRALIYGIRQEQSLITSRHKTNFIDKKPLRLGITRISDNTGNLTTYCRRKIGTGGKCYVSLPLLGKADRQGESGPALVITTTQIHRVWTFQLSVINLIEIPNKQARRI